MTKLGLDGKQKKHKATKHHSYLWHLRRNPAKTLIKSYKAHEEAQHAREIKKLKDEHEKRINQIKAFEKIQNKKSIQNRNLEKLDAMELKK